MAFTCGAIVGGDDNDALLELLTITIVAPVAPPVDCEIAVLLLVVAICCCCCFGRAATLPAVVVGFVVVVVCCGDDDDDDDTTADVGGGIAADNEGGFTVFGIPHIFDSVVLTTLRVGLLGSHNFALSSGDIVVLSELLLLAAGDEDGDDDNCCANT